METKRLGRTNISVSPAGMGVLTVGRTQRALSVPEGARVVLYALERGIDFLDTAEFYETYPYIRKALRMRSSALADPVISSKSLSGAYEGMQTAIEDCRRALDRDQIDIFLLHEIRQTPDFENRAGAWQCLIDAKARGIIKAIGLSTHHVDAARLAAGLPDLDVLFPLVNFRSLGIRNGAGPGAKEDMAAAIEAAAIEEKGVFVMKALGGGNMCSDYREALDYVTGLPGVSSVMIGMGCEKDVDDAIDYFAGRMPKDYRPDVAQKRMRVDQGDCEGCGTCIPRCASKAIRFNKNGLAEINQTVCVTCGYCAYACPVRAIILW